MGNKIARTGMSEDELDGLLSKFQCRNLAELLQRLSQLEPPDDAEDVPESVKITSLLGNYRVLLDRDYPEVRSGTAWHRTLYPEKYLDSPPKDLVVRDRLLCGLGYMSWCLGFRQEPIVSGRRYEFGRWVGQLDQFGDEAIALMVPIWSEAVHLVTSTLSNLRLKDVPLAECLRVARQVYVRQYAEQSELARKLKPLPYTRIDLHIPKCPIKFIGIPPVDGDIVAWMETRRDVVKFEFPPETDETSLFTFDGANREAIEQFDKERFSELCL